MISLLIFYLNTIAAVWLFTTHWQETDWKEGMLAVGTLALVFSVGWPMSSFILKFIFDEKGLAVWLDRDTLSLVLLAAMESLFFYIQLKRKKSNKAILNETKEEEL